MIKYKNIYDSLQTCPPVLEDNEIKNEIKKWAYEEDSNI